MRKVEDSLFKDSVASEKSHLCSQVQVLTTNTTFLPQLLRRPSCAASFGLGSHLLSSTRGDEAFSILEERQRTHTTRELTTEMNLFFLLNWMHTSSQRGKNIFSEEMPIQQRAGSLH